MFRVLGFRGLGSRVLNAHSRMDECFVVATTMKVSRQNAHCHRLLLSLSKDLSHFSHITQRHPDFFYDSYDSIFSINCMNALLSHHRVASPPGVASPPATPAGQS